LTNQGINVSLHHWSRCDVPFNDVLPMKCTPYTNGTGYSDNVATLADAFEEVIKDLKDDFEAAFVYYPNVDNVGHHNGPDTDETKTEVKAVDAVINTFIANLKKEGLAKTTNFIIVADHGMSDRTNKVINDFPLFTKDFIADICCTFRLSKKFQPLSTPPRILKGL
jgi:predicted AlkP superfamily pyrophosphatase or phosphodiesterase